jgi:hypothetical protein
MTFLTYFPREVSALISPLCPIMGVTNLQDLWLESGEQLVNNKDKAN